MQPPEGYTKAILGQIGKLKWSLYGLKHASRQWNSELTRKLQKFGFHQSIHDNCLFVKQLDHVFIALIVYLDNVLVTRTNKDDIVVVKKFLHS